MSYGDLHNRDNDDNDDNDGDQIGPPKLQAVAGAATLARLVGDILGLSVLGLFEGIHIAEVSPFCCFRFRLLTSV